MANETEMDNNPNLVGHVGQFDAYEGGVCNFMEWIGSGGQIEILDDEGNANITTDKNQESMEFLSGLIQPRFQNLSATDAVIPRTALTMDEGSSNSVWLAGNAICMRQWPFAYDLTKATNDLNATDGSGNYTQFGITRMPIKSGATNAKSSVVGGAVLSVSTYSNNKQEAFNLIRYLGDQDAQEYELTSTANFPALKSVFSNPPSGYEWITDFASAAQSTLSRPVHPKYSQMSTQIADGFSSLLSGAKNVSTSLAEMEEDVNEIIAGGATETGGIPGYPVGLIAVASLFSIGIMVAIMKKKH